MSLKRSILMLACWLAVGNLGFTQTAPADRKVAAPYGAGNSTPAGQRARIILDVLDDVRRQYAIDPDLTYLTGFSGGGRMACAIGFALPEYFGGVIPLCGTNTIGAPTYLRHR